MYLLFFHSHTPLLPYPPLSLPPSSLPPSLPLCLSQILEGEEHIKVSRINLIDVAGSEKSSVAHTTGERLRVSQHLQNKQPTLNSPDSF